MIEISQEEFEEKLKGLIDGTISSKTKLAKELQTDIRTLENKIQELAGYNMELYLNYIDKFEYRQKSREDIDFEALIIEIIKNNMQTETAVQKYNIGERTIRRHVKSIEKENPELISLYKAVKALNRNGVPLTLKQQEKIDQLVERKVKISELNLQRKEYLEEIEEIFTQRNKTMGKEEAAKSMGTTSNRIYKMINELYRIRIEENTKKQKDNFIYGLKIKKDVKIVPNNNITNISIQENEKGEEK